MPGCGEEFPVDHYGQFVRHVKACAKRNSHIFEEIVADRGSSLFTSSIDPELRSHLKQGGT